jgi:hypothetical protein
VSSASTGSKKKKAAAKDYGAWRKGFRAEFALLHSDRSLRLDAALRLLMEAAVDKRAFGADESGDKPELPDPPSPLFSSLGASANQARTTAALLMAAPPAFGGPPSPTGAEGLELPRDDLAMPSEATVDSWDGPPQQQQQKQQQQRVRDPGGGSFDAGVGALRGAKEGRAAEAAAEAKQRSERQQQLSAAWAQGLAHVKHAHACFGAGSTLLAERRAALGPTAAVVLQAFVRRVLGALRVAKLKERLRQRAMSQSRASGMFGRSSKAPSRAGSTSSRGSAASKLASARSRAGSARASGTRASAAPSASFRQSLSKPSSRGSSR